MENPKTTSSQSRRPHPLPGQQGLRQHTDTFPLQQARSRLTSQALPNIRALQRQNSAPTPLEALQNHSGHGFSPSHVLFQHLYRKRYIKITAFFLENN